MILKIKAKEDLFIAGIDKKFQIICYIDKDTILIHPFRKRRIDELFLFYDKISEKKEINTDLWYPPKPLDVLKTNYLLKESNEGCRAHLWNGNNTVCRVFSTSSMAISKKPYTLHNDRKGRKLCKICMQKYTNRLNHPERYKHAINRPIELLSDLPDF